MKRSKKNTLKKTNVETKQLKEKNILKKSYKYIFLVLVLISIFIDIASQLNKIQFENNNITTQIHILVTFISIILGGLSLFFEKTKLNDRINRINNKKQYFYSKKSKLNFLFFIVIVFISIFTLFYKLDYFDIYSDEVTVVNSGAGYYHTGEFKTWDFIKDKAIGKSESRARPHQFIVAQSYKLFGINTWASRFPSAFFGVLLIILLFFIGNFFIKEETAVLLTIFSFAFYFNFLALGRWARMYAMIYPFFLISVLFLYKFLTEKSSFLTKKIKPESFIIQFFNYNYLYLPILLLVIFFNLKLHQNTTILFPVFITFSLILAFVFRNEKKHITSIIVGIIILIIQIINPYKVSFNRFTFFNIKHGEEYIKILFGYPFSEYTNIIFLTLGIFSLFLIKNKTYIKKHILLYTLTGLTFVLFSFVFDYAYHYRYVSFVTPFIVLLILENFILIIKILFNKYIKILFVSLLIAFILINFTKNFDKLYVNNSISPARPSIAHKTIVNNFKKGDVIFRHYGPKIYLKGINKNTKFIDIASASRIKTFFEIFEQLKKYKSGWLIWHTYYSWNIDKNLIDYANLLFKKYHGYGVDNTGEEVFYFNNKMLISYQTFIALKNIPSANLKLNNSYSFIFNLTIDSLTDGNIFVIKNDSINKLACKVKREFLIIKSYNKDSVFTKLPIKKENTITFLQDVRNKKTTIKLFLNDKEVSSKEISTNNDLVKFSINPKFNGNIDKIRIYDFVLNNMQLKKIKNDTTNSEILKIGNKEFKTLYLWQKK